jgi:plasmid stabilization system protein ParE
MVQPSIEFHPNAIDEARTARLWYAERSDSAANAFVTELDIAIERITSAPESCPVYLHGTRRYLLKRFPYVVVFRVRSIQLQVIAVAHGRRMPGYWRNRLK